MTASKIEINSIISCGVQSKVFLFSLALIAGFNTNAMEGVNADIPAIDPNTTVASLDSGAGEIYSPPVTMQKLGYYAVATSVPEQSNKSDLCRHPGNDVSDEHLKHRQMLAAKKGYRRTEHDYSMPMLSMTSMEGDRISMEDILNTSKPVMLNFIFTSCTTICPVLSATLSQVQDQLGDEVRDIKMVSISIDPEFDSPDKLQAYAKRYRAGDQWEFYTGSVMEIISAQKAFKTYRGTKMNHEPVTFIRGSKDSKWVRLEGIASAGDIVNEYQQLVTQ